MPIGLAQRGDLFVSIAPWLGLLVVLILAVVAVGLLVVYYHRNVTAVQISIFFVQIMINFTD